MLNAVLDSLSGTGGAQKRLSLKPSPRSAHNKETGSARSGHFPVLSMSFRSPFSIRASRHPARVVLIKGKRGTGKSSVVSWLRAHAAERDIPVVTTRSLRFFGSEKPLIMWKKIFHQLTAKNDFQSNDGQWTHISNLLQEVFPNMAQLTDHVSLTALCEALGVGRLSFGKIADLEKSGSSSFVPGKETRCAQSKGKLLTENRAEHLRDAMIKVFSYLFAQQPALLIIENVHLAGERCLDLLVHLLPKLSHPSAVVLTALIADGLPGPKPFAERGDDAVVSHGSDALTRQTSSFTATKMAALQANSIESSPWFLTYRPLILNHKPVTILVLNNYTQRDIESMLCTALGVNKAPPELLQLVQDFSGGSFFWVREILQFIKEHGAEQFMSAIGEGKPKDGDNSLQHGPQSSPLRREPSLLQAGKMQRHRSEIKPMMRAPSFQSANSHRNVSSPHHAQLDKLLLVRFGGLTQDAQRVLRTASVIGVTFTKSVLLEVLPKHLKQNVQENLDALVLQLWLFEDADNDQLYAFAHLHAQQVIYELTPSSERNLLYALIANYVDEMHGDDPAYFTALSHYYLHCDTDKALQYVVKAEEALLEVHTIYDFTEAVDLLGSALSACKTSHDLDIMRKLVENCRASIQQYSWNPKARQGPLPGSEVWVAVGRFVCCLSRESNRIAPQEGGLEGSVEETLLVQERQARDLFLKHLEKLDGQLNSMMVGFDEDADGAEAEK